MNIRMVMLAVLLGLATAQPAGAQSAAEAAVRPGDVLVIRIWPDAELSGEFPIEDTGLVFLPILGGVPAGGRTVSELRTDLRARYAESMRSPVVSITPLRRVNVMGAVAQPGVYLVPPTEGLIEVVLRAGGIQERANPNSIRLIRQGRTVDVDLGRVLREGASPETALRSGDTVMVPTRTRITWSAFHAVLQVATIAAVLVTRVTN